MNLLTAPKVWATSKTQLREAEKIKERMNWGLYWASLWQGEVRCWGPQEAELQAESAQPPLLLRLRTWSRPVWECWSTKYWWFNAHLVLSALPLSQKSHISELGPGNGKRPEFLSSCLWYLWGSTTTTKSDVHFHQFSKKFSFYFASIYYFRSVRFCFILDLALIILFHQYFSWLFN